MCTTSRRAGTGRSSSLPPPSNVQDVAWSPDGEHISYDRLGRDGRHASRSRRGRVRRSGHGRRAEHEFGRPGQPVVQRRDAYRPLPRPDGRGVRAALRDQHQWRWGARRADLRRGDGHEVHSVLDLVAGRLDAHRDHRLPRSRPDSELHSRSLSAAVASGPPRTGRGGGRGAQFVPESLLAVRLRRRRGVVRSALL